MGEINFQDVGYAGLVDMNYIDDEFVTDEGMKLLNSEFGNLDTLTATILEQWSNYQTKSTTFAHLRALLEWFMRNYPEVTTEEIAQASQSYLESVLNKTYLMMLKNFIRKKDDFQDIESELFKWVEINRSTGGFNSNYEIKL